MRRTPATRFTTTLNLFGWNDVTHDLIPFHPIIVIHMMQHLCSVVPCVNIRQIGKVIFIPTYLLGRYDLRTGL